MTKQQNKTQNNNNNKEKKIKGKYCSLPLSLGNPIRTDFISSLSILPRLFFAATTFMPSPLGSPALLYASVPPAPARIWPWRELCLGCVAGTHQAPGGGFDWWQMKVCFPVPTNLLAMRTHPSHKRGPERSSRRAVSGWRLCFPSSSAAGAAPCPGHITCRQVTRWAATVMCDCAGHSHSENHLVVMRVRVASEL